MTRTFSVSTVLRLSAVLALVGSAAACQDSLARRETISYQAGDAVAWNKAVHTIDPWPASSADAEIPVSGRRVVNAIERYESRGAPLEAGLGTPTAPIPVVPAAAGPAPR